MALRDLCFSNLREVERHRMPLLNYLKAVQRGGEWADIADRQIANLCHSSHPDKNSGSLKEFMLSDSVMFTGPDPKP